MTATGGRLTPAYERIGLHKSRCRTDGGIIVTKHPAATAIGRGILASGGSAFDAAIAASFALGAVEPSMSGLGGVGLALAWKDRAFTVLDAGPVAPHRLDLDRYRPVSGVPDRDLFGWPRVVDDANQLGATSVCVPTMVALMESLHRLGGTRPWSELVEPAISLARHAQVDWLLTLNILNDQQTLSGFPSTAAVFCPGGRVPVYSLDDAASGILRQEDLALTLGQIATRGAASFYRGAIAEIMTSFLRSQGASVTADDFSSTGVRVANPLSTRIGNAEVWVTDGLNGGPTVVELFRSRRSLGLRGAAWGSVDDLSAWVRAGSSAFAERLARMGHTSAAVREGAQGTETRAVGRSDDSTTYLAVVDHDGDAVSLNLTLLSRWGSKLVVPGLGILLNNGMMWFDPEPGKPNSLAPAARALANMVPTACTVNGELRALIGVSGGRRIISALPQIHTNLQSHGMDIQDAIAAPRLEFSTNPMLADPRFGEGVLDQVERVTSKKFKRYLPRLGSNGYASAVGLWRDEDGQWTAGMDPMGLAEAGCT